MPKCGRNVCQIASLPEAPAVVASKVAETSGVATPNDFTSGSVLAGNIAGNPFLESGPARLIVNEVTGGNLSTLAGRIEVYGSPADVVIANPWGITCNGCGFINTNRASLVTGRPVWNGNALDGFNVTGSQLTIGAAGLSAPSLGSLDLIAGNVKIDGNVQLNSATGAAYVIAGPNQVSYTTLAPTALARTDAVPTNGIDIGSAGGMYANQIYLLANERGVGVNHLGTLNAGAGGLTLDAAGRLTSYAPMRAANGGAVVVSADTFLAQSSELSATGLGLVQAGDIQFINSSLVAKDLMLSSSGKISTSNTSIRADSDVRISSGAETALTGGRIAAGGNVSLSAVGDLLLLPSVGSTFANSGGNSRTTTRYVRAEIEAGKSIAAQSTAGTVILDAAQLTAKAGSISIQGNGVALNARKDFTSEVTVSGSTTTKPTAETLVGTKLKAEGDIAVLASGTSANQGNLFASAAWIESNNGHVSLMAARDVDITHDITTATAYERFYEEKSNWFRTKITDNLKTSVDETVQASLIAGKSAAIGAGRNLNVVASGVIADGAIGLHADGNLNLLSAAENDYAYSSSSVKKSGIFGNGGLSITIGSKTSTAVSATDLKTQNASSVASLSGDILATAGGQYLQLSSDLTAPQGDVNIAAANVAIKSASNTTSVLNIIRERQSGLTLSASHPLISTAQTIDQMVKIGSRTDNGRYQAMSFLTAALTVYNNYKTFDRDLMSAADPLTGKGLGGWNLSATLGSSSFDFDSIAKSSTPVSSSIDAGRNLSITATGKTADTGDITLIAAKLNAAGDVRLSAQRDITLAAAIGTSSEDTKTRSSSGAIGLNYSDAGGLNFTLAASRSNGYSNGWGTTYWQSQVGAGEKLSIESGRDLALNGAKASGKSVLARVGTSGEGNMAITSPQDQDHYIAKEQSWGINISVPIPIAGVPSAPPSLGLNASQLSLLGEYEAVRQQTAINAGTGGFDINVNGHTHLRGGAITTEGNVGASKLVTQTLTHETLSNQEVVSGKSWSVSLSIADKATDQAADSAKKSGLGPLAGSSVGYARIDTNYTSNTPSSVGGAITLTRGDIQAAKIAAVKAAEYDPINARYQAAFLRYQTLLENEPPKCDTCYIESMPGGTTATRSTMNSSMGSAASATLNGNGETLDALGGSARWNAWNAAVRAARFDMAKLSNRMTDINEKTYGEANTAALISGSSLHQPLLQTFDKGKATQQLKDGVAVTAAFGKAAFKTAGDYAEQKAKDAVAACGGNASNCPEADKWKEGGVYRATLHAVVGAVSFGQAGALGAMTAELAYRPLKDVLTQAGFAEDSLAFNMLMIGAKSMIAAGVGGTNGAAAAFNADANNRQLHPIEVDIIKQQARNFARQQKGGAEPTQAEVNAAEKRLGQEAFRSVQFGAQGNTDGAAQAFLRNFQVQLPGDPSITGQTVGFSFYTDPLQKANPNMYANLVVNSYDMLDFYQKNQITQPTYAQAEAAIARYQQGRDKAESWTKLAGLFAGGLTLAPLAPSAITACLANITLCGISAVEMAAGAQLGPTGMGIGAMANRAAVKKIISAEEANALQLAARPNSLPAWTEGTAVLLGDLKVGTRVGMYVNAKTAAEINEGTLTGLGSWATFDEPVKSVAQMRQNMALKETFGGKAPSDGPFYFVQLEVTKTMQTRIGYVGPQADAATPLVGTAKYQGGGTQIEIVDFAKGQDYVRVIAPPKKVGG